MLRLLSAGAVVLLTTSTALATVVSLPADFATIQGSNGLFYEAIGDSRSVNVTNPGVGISTMTLNPGVGYWHLPGAFPQAYFDFSPDFIYLHPGTFGTANLASSVRFEAPATGWYHAAGAFARVNINTGYGNGVDLSITRGDDLDAPLWTSYISQNHVVDLGNAFGGSGVANFNLDVFLQAGESMRFIVFSDSQGLDGTFDGTGFVLTITEVPEPSTVALGILAIIGLIAFLPKKTFPHRPAGRIKGDGSTPFRHTACVFPF